MALYKVNQLFGDDDQPSIPLKLSAPSSVASSSVSAAQVKKAAPAAAKNQNVHKTVTNVSVPSVAAKPDTPKQAQARHVDESVSDFIRKFYVTIFVAYSGLRHKDSLMGWDSLMDCQRAQSQKKANRTREP